MKPIYCIEEYEYFNPFGHLALKYDQVYFLVLISCREGTAQFHFHLSDLVDACKEQAPKLYLYLENLMTNMEAFNGSETRLIRALERDGFDVSRLLHAFFDNSDLQALANWIKKYGKNQQRITVQKIKEYLTENEESFEDVAFLDQQKEITGKVYDAMKELSLGYLPTVNLLETDLLNSFNRCLYKYALVMVDKTMLNWKYLMQKDKPDTAQGFCLTTILSDRRQFYLHYRQKHPVEGCENSPIFCVEIVEFVEAWELRGLNKVTVWYKLTCAEGEWYNEIDFEYLMQEALLYFPELYADAMLYYHASRSPRPRDPAMLRGLQRMGYDLTPVLASYVANRENFLPKLREEMRLREALNDPENPYERKRRWEVDYRDPEQLKQSQLVSVLRDGLVSEGMSVILRELPEFHIRAPKSFLDNMEHWMHHDFIDPINDLDKELESVFELNLTHSAPLALRG